MKAQSLRPRPPHQVHRLGQILLLLLCLRRIHLHQTRRRRHHRHHHRHRLRLRVKAILLALTAHTIVATIDTATVPKRKGLDMTHLN